VCTLHSLAMLSLVGRGVPTGRRYSSSPMQ
jgi:hypothetical protein